MNGRCENDALDGAVDVCDACGGEFCRDCLLFHNGPKKAPLCTACAISTSGVRKAAKRERLQSKSSASKRRKELRALAAEQQTQSLVMLDDIPDLDLTPVAEAKPKKRRLRRKSDAPSKAEADHDAADEIVDQSLGGDEMYEHDAFVPFDFDDDSSNAGSASKLIDEIRTNGAVEQVTSDEADMWNLPDGYQKVDAETNFESTPAFHSEPKFESESVLEPEPDIEAEQVFEPNPAIDSGPGLNLEHVFDAELDSEPATESVAESEPQQPHQWETLHNPDASNPFDDPSAGRIGSKNSSGATPEPSKPAPQPSEQAPKSERRVNRVPAPQHRSPSPTASSSVPAAPAPLVQPEPEPRRLRMKDMLRPKAEARNPAPAPAPAPAPTPPRERVQDPTNDTDATGQWIPPNLRGMVASEEQTELPKRSRRGS